MFLQLAELFNGSGWDDVLWMDPHRKQFYSSEGLFRCLGHAALMPMRIKKNQSDENMCRRITHREPRVPTHSWRLFLQSVGQRDKPDEAIHANQAEKTKTNNHLL